MVDAVPVGTRPGPITSGAGSVWVGNLRRPDGDAGSMPTADGRRHDRARPPDADRTRFGFGCRVGGARPARAAVAHRPAVQRARAAADRRRRHGVRLPERQRRRRDRLGLGSLRRLDPRADRAGDGTRGGVDARRLASRPESWSGSGSDLGHQLRRGERRALQPGDVHGSAAQTRSASGRRPIGIAAGDGSDLGREQRAATRSSRIDPDSGAVEQTIAVGEHPTAVAADDDAVWVANTAAGTVSRIDPATNEVERHDRGRQRPVRDACLRTASSG